VERGNGKGGRAKSGARSWIAEGIGEEADLARSY
jgi:hypothetical protein